MPRKSKPKGGVRAGALNVKHGQSLAQQKQDLKKAMARGDVLSLSEIKSNGLLQWVRGQGWGVYRAKGKAADTAVIWNKAKYRAVNAGSKKLNNREGSTGGMRTRFAAYVQLTDVTTGQTFWQISAHTTPPKQGSPAVRNAIRAEQYKSLSQLVNQLGGQVILAGDLNFLNPQIAGQKSSTPGGIMHVIGGKGISVVNTGKIGDAKLNSDHAAVFVTAALNNGKPLSSPHNADPTAGWDIIGGPNVKPVKPNRADYEPGGKWHGLVAWSVVQQHYQHAMDAWKNGYWYHANGRNYTQAQENHNNKLKGSGSFQTSFGMPTGNLTAARNQQQDWHYEFKDGRWTQVSNTPGGGGTGGPGGGAGGPAGPGQGGGPTGIGGLPVQAPPTFTGFSNGDLGGGPMQNAPGAPPKQNGDPLFGYPGTGLPNTPTGPGTPGSPTGPSPAPTGPQAPDGPGVQDPQQNNDMGKQPGSVGLPVGGTNGPLPAPPPIGKSDPRLPMDGSSAPSVQTTVMRSTTPSISEYLASTTTASATTTATPAAQAAAYASKWWDGNLSAGQQAYIDSGATSYNEFLAMQGGGGGGGGTDMTDDQLSAFKLFANVLASWGIPMGADIEAIIKAAVIDGISPDQIELIIPDIQATETWKARFPGWSTRVSNGYNQLTVGEYLALENAYHRILQSAGLPSGFYDDPSDFGQWISNNVSPDEIQGRVEDALNLVRQVDPTARGLLAQFYGVGAGDIAAYFLDPNRALPTLDRQYKAVNVASWAVKNGLNLMGSQHYEELVDKGVSAEMAAQGYGTVAQFSRVLGNLGDIYGDQFTQGDAENDVFFNQNEKRRKLVQKEVAAFSGSSGFNPGVSQRGSSAGSY